MESWSCHSWFARAYLVITFRIEEQARNPTIEPTVYVYDDPNDTVNGSLADPSATDKVVVPTTSTGVFFFTEL